MDRYDDLREAIRAIDPVDERESQSLRSTLGRLDWPANPFDERLNDHHVTASAFVVSSRGVILHRHKRLGIWVQPGGHIDYDESAPQAALRETYEETGLRVRHLTPPLLFHVDVHPGPRGHTHYDLRYVLLAAPAEPNPLVGESRQVYWFSFEGARERCEKPLAAALEKLGRWYAASDVKDYEP
jgi:8-oxo-dGTP pyrophosphatase MutT (NUDIX family)